MYILHWITIQNKKSNETYQNVHAFVSTGVAFVSTGVKFRTQGGVHFIADSCILQIKTQLRCQEHTSDLNMEQVLAKMDENNQCTFLDPVL